MVTIEKIINGYIVKFKNTEKIEVKVYFESFEKLTEWLKNQFENEGTK